MRRFEPNQKIIYEWPNMKYKVQCGDCVKLKEKKFKKPLLKSKFFKKVLNTHSILATKTL